MVTMSGLVCVKSHMSEPTNSRNRQLPGMCSRRTGQPSLAESTNHLSHNGKMLWFIFQVEAFIGREGLAKEFTTNDHIAVGKKGADITELKRVHGDKQVGLTFIVPTLFTFFISVDPFEFRDVGCLFPDRHVVVCCELLVQTFLTDESLHLEDENHNLFAGDSGCVIVPPRACSALVNVRDLRVNGKACLPYSVLSAGLSFFFLFRG